LRRFLRAAIPADMAEATEGPDGGPPAAALEMLASFVGSQPAIALSFVTTFRNLVNPAAPDAVRDAYNAYFFSATGYATADGSRIVAPIHLGDLDLSKGKGLLGPETGERYVRDLVRLLVESVDDVRYTVGDRGLKARFSEAHELAKKRPKDVSVKLTTWFKGVSALAESQVMGAVEQVALGVSTFQTNPLLAAAAGTFAGTAARKAAQHVFLAELNT
jgi:hypothetical protein